MLVISAAGFVGSPDKLTESSPDEPERILKDRRIPDCFRGDESKISTEATGEPQVPAQVRDARLVACVLLTRNSALLNCRCTWITSSELGK